VLRLGVLGLEVLVVEHEQVPVRALVYLADLFQVVSVVFGILWAQLGVAVVDFDPRVAYVVGLD